ncbi:MAG: DUF3786 domain-containing protein [Desulfococcaceae bacterium]
MENQAPIFQEIYENYLAEVAALSLSSRAEPLGIRVDGDAATIPFFHRSYTVTPAAVADEEGRKPSHAVCVILCKYLLLCPDNPVPDAAVVTYKDFREAGPYVGGFHNTAQRPIAEAFSGRLEELGQRCKALGGTVWETDVNCDLAVAFPALPRVPTFLIFNDADEEFDAECSLFFRRDAAQYLDMECLAMIGMTMAEWL